MGHSSGVPRSKIVVRCREGGYGLLALLLLCSIASELSLLMSLCQNHDLMSLKNLTNSNNLNLWPRLFCLPRKSACSLFEMFFSCRRRRLKAFNLLGGMMSEMSQLLLLIYKEQVLLQSMKIMTLIMFNKLSPLPLCSCFICYQTPSEKFSINSSCDALVSTPPLIIFSSQILYLMS